MTEGGGGVRWLDTIPSTQDEAHRLAAGGAPHGTAVAARIQSAGRGTRGREWVSTEGGLWLSVVSRPEGGGGTTVEVLALRVGLALAEFLDGLLLPPAHIGLKWPNDLMLGAGKVGGVLAEARWQGESLGWIVVGVGLNLRNELPAGAVPPAVRLLDAGVQAAPNDLAEPIADVVTAAARTAAPLTSDELSGFAARDWLRGRALRLPEAGGGIANGISAGGRLRVRRPDGSVIEVLGAVDLPSFP